MSQRSLFFQDYRIFFDSKINLILSLNNIFMAVILIQTCDKECICDKYRRIVLDFVELQGGYIMESNSAMTVGEKLRQIRVSKGLSQENVAYAIKKSTNIVSLIESGKRNLTDEMLEGIRKFLEVENAPILEHEVELYINRLDMWDEILDADRREEAKAKQRELASILDLPYEHNLIFRYTMLEVRILLKEANLPPAREKLDAAEAIIEYADTKSLCTYYQNKGFIIGLDHKYKESLKFFLQALELAESGSARLRLLANIGGVYVNLGKYYKGILYFERAKAEYSDKTNIAGCVMDQKLAMCYLRIGEYDNCKKLLDKVLSQYKTFNYSGPRYGEALMYMGNFYGMTGDPQKAITFYDQTLPYFKGYFDNFVPMLYYAKAAALISLKKLAEAQEIIDQGRHLAHGNELYNMMFDIGQHGIDLNNPKSISFFEDVAIPYLRALGGENSYSALLVCKELEAHYKKKKSKVKALTISNIIREIYEEMFFGDVTYDVT